MLEYLDHLLQGYGYFAVAAMVALESLGLPLPGEATLIGAAIYAASSHRLQIWYIVLACAGGSTAGGIAAYWIGRKLGFWLLTQYGRHIGLHPHRLNIAQYLFQRGGGVLVFFGRFIAVLRSFAGLLAGANRMRWIEFAIFNAAGAVVWAALYGFCAFYFTNEVRQFTGPVGLGVGIVAGMLIVAGFVWVRAHEHELAAQAEKSMRPRMDRKDKDPVSASSA